MVSDIFKKYRAHKQCCKGRFDRNGNAIDMKLSFEEWVAIWMDSGHWEDRGVHKGQYVMSRVNDLGSYEIGNVFIQHNSENLREGNLGKTYTKEQKEYFSSCQRGRCLNPEHANNVRQSNVLNKSKACTVDGVIIYPSRKALIEALGRNSNGSLSSNFRYVQ